MTWWRAGCGLLGVGGEGSTACSAPAVEMRGNRPEQDGADFAPVSVAWNARNTVPNLPPSRSEPPPDHATVVLVDPEALYRWFVTESLQGHGIDVLPCQSLDEAAAVLQTHGAADLLIIEGDLLLGRDGATLHALSRGGRCVVLDSDGDWRREGDGAVTFADKPVDADAVVQLVTGHLRGQRPAA